MKYDYIMKMIEQFVQAIASIMLRRKEGDYVQALEQIKTASRYYLRQDFNTLLLYSGEQIATQFKDLNGNLDFERCILAADLIYEQALIHEAKKEQTAAIWLKSKCLYLYNTVVHQEEQFQTKEYFEKISNLEAELKQYNARQE